MLGTLSDRIDDFDFDLPEELIALRPVTPRTEARLLVVRGQSGRLEDLKVGDLPKLLSPGDMLVMNRSRVIRAALSGVRIARSTDGTDVVVHINLNRRTAANQWSAFARPAKRVAKGDRLQLGADFHAEVVDVLGEGEFLLEFTCSGSELDQCIESSGAAPLPPYISSRRPVDEQDTADYQTVYAKEGESVAAPTAGLHFSSELLEDLRSQGISTATVRLDVNAGTFRPVKSETLSAHNMHLERAILDEATATQIAAGRSVGGRCVAVGTTSMRVLESAARDGRLEPFDDDTDIFIRPGFEFRVCDALITNFHLPKSTLFVLVSAYMGIDLMRRAYQHAIDQRYRFFSYGDACLLLPNG